MKEKWRALWGRAAPVLGQGLRALGRGLALYLDDLCLLGAGCCCTAAAAELAGKPGALICAGVWLTAYAVVIAQSRRGGGGK